MKKLILTLLAIYAIVYAIEAQTVVSLEDMQPSGEVSPLADQAVYEDEVSDAHLIWAAPGFKKDRIGAPTREQLFVLEGRALFTLDGEPREITPGHWIILPAHTPHTIEVVGDTRLKLLAIQDKSKTQQDE